jgi:predicted nucleotidyltransferase component of viral defense system
MPLDEAYRRQVALLLRLMPSIAEEPCFALKGGTAINLFVRKLPRLSVDIDLAYLPIEDRETSLRGVEAALERVAARALRAVPDASIQRHRTAEEGRVFRLVVAHRGAQVKIEVTPVLRGTVFPPEWRPVNEAVAEQFAHAEMMVISFADLYAGKIVAALDRQNPRDLFDVRELLAAEGIDENLRRAFLVYVVRHGRPMAEVLEPRRKDIRQEFERGFAGMTAKPVTLHELIDAREALVADIVGKMPGEQRRFLLDLKMTGQADWEGLGLEAAQRLPAVLWKLHNLARIPPDERVEMAGRLAEVLELELPDERRSS